MSIPKHLIEKANQVSIIEILERFGHKPQKVNGSEVGFFSPFGIEKEPSFYVNTKKNVFIDFGDRGKGDAIQIYRQLTNKSFYQSVNDLLNNEFSSVKSGNQVFTSPLIIDQTKNKFLLEKPFESKYLIEYAQSRFITPEVLNMYCKEVHYKNGKTGKLNFAIGFKNDSQGYEIRTKDFKANLTVKDITTIAMSCFSVDVYEGFFSYMSALELNPSLKLNHAIILNSLSMVNRVNWLKYQQVNCFLDNDKAGLKAFDKIKAINKNAYNLSPKNFKDLNDLLQDVRKQEINQKAENGTVAFSTLPTQV